MTKTFKHSGTLGDLIFSLPVVQKMGGGEFKVALRNVENCVAKYGYRPEEVADIHKGRFTDKDFEMLAPLLERQSYVTKASTWILGDNEPDVDLDAFRGVLFRTFEGNYNQAYHLTFGLPFTQADYHTTWLEADANAVAPIVFCRTFRYRSPNSDEIWKNVVDGIPSIEDMSIFLGLPDEHADFCRAVGKNIPYYPVSDFLEMANVIAGAELLATNQNFMHSIGVGLGKDMIFEPIKIKPLQINECYFPRANIQHI